MARSLRIQKSGGWYHLTARGNERRPIYRDQKDRRHFCELLAELVERYRFRIQETLVFVTTERYTDVHAPFHCSPTDASIFTLIREIRNPWSSQLCATIAKVHRKRKPPHWPASSEAQTTSASLRANTCRFEKAGGA